MSVAARRAEQRAQYRQWMIDRGLDPEVATEVAAWQLPDTFTRHWTEGPEPRE